MPKWRSGWVSSPSRSTTSTGRTRSACFWRSARAFPPTASPGSKPTCALAARRPWNRKSSPASPPGRTGFSSAPTPSARRARSSATAPAKSRYSIRAGCESGEANSDRQIARATRERGANGCSPHSLLAIRSSPLEEYAMSDIVNVDYSTKIPNNVSLTEGRHPGYLDWWKTMGPDGFQEALVYLRTAVSVDPKGWAKFDYVKMPEYRWGILLAPHEEGRTIPFGQHYGKPAWQEVPGEYRAMLRRLVVIQGDTEPASVEQQRHLGKTAPSLYDMRNVFQVNVEEGRHLWAMVYILQKYFGRDGREEAEQLLQRRSGDPDKPRMLGAFNEATPDWLSFHMFTFFTDRDGKMQLESLAQSGFDPLSRTCRFMLTEEAHHMFVGETGIGRTIQRTCEAMKAAGIEDPSDINKARDLGVIDLPTIQKKLNLHYSLSLDLFGSEVSTNAANAFNASLKGRFQETKIEDD